MERTTNRVNEKSAKKIHPPMEQGPPEEGELTKKVEQFTARVPSLVYLGLAVGSMLLSASMATLTRKKTLANFVGLWVPTILLFGIYNKIVKHDASETGSVIH
jgi:hypothetical protein